MISNICQLAMFCLLPAIGMLWNPALADDPELKKKPTDTALSGLVIDKTLTPTGRRFYREFARLWWELNTTLPGNLVVFERPDALRGSQISIFMNRKVLVVTGLSPARIDIHTKALNALGTVEYKVKLLTNSQLYTNNPDLGPDEF